MNTPFICDDKDRLIAFLYGEADRDDAAAIEAHLAGCAACAADLAAFSDVRRDLRHWEPPEAELGFRMVQETAPPRRWWRPAVWFPVAAAAVLVLAAAATIANLEVKYGQDGVSVRTGWRAPASASPGDDPPAAPIGSEEAAATPGVSAEEVTAALAALEARLRGELTPSSAAAPTRQAAAPVVERGELLQSVRALIEESERRQQRELALRLAQVVQDFDAQRRADLVRIENGFGQIEGLTEEEAARQRRLLNYLVRTSQRP
jgi:Putative zinc-finger